MYLVAGLGITGQSVLRYFQAQGEHCFAYDTRDELDVSKLAKAFPEVEFATGHLPTSWIQQFDTIVLSPGIAQSEPWVNNLRKLGKQVIGDVELFARSVGVPVIGITGSNGKSSVTTLTGLAFQKAGYNVAVGGNLGEPVLDLLMDENEYDLYVLELSSFQLETTYSLQTVSSTVLNISEDHMDRYDGLEDYIQAKTKLFETTDLAVLPEGFSEQGVIHHCPVVHFGISPDFIKSDSDYGLQEENGHLCLANGSNCLVKVEDMALQGRHHLLNALAMIALCQPYKLPVEVFRDVLKEFKGLPHRTQLVVNYRDVEWINDSKGTNVGATLTAIESIGQQAYQHNGKVILLAGGVGKEADFSPLQPAVHQYCREVILFGRDRNLIAEVLPHEQVRLVETLKEAVEIAGEVAQPYDCVLLSPACASFDQFSNYEERGKVFESYVGELIAAQEQD
ncbi:UDP-N-acetylmuramoyl-L-alanine--D-glutamate ligase [Thiomicrorhabdus sp. ZW0627]|uniref:UDP-N-acetylmuramoyl-L-alanine--D-glutamate ligase n=1 Tax=Thiomicrorhabdus sp. ZW0627 TaxID=3039774 RepID=UPI002436D44C|nr:UDP-N-acetylmuramoyl-L-alanine--D-glutamate ligase [Thiomicrorhabdus sp. ZW0627]MDG6774021.1 UDP-N-acetylmuramoyl-L-alanine--D-glutamate ligase [Thiomicrorhabdus sp. ZW0627]